MKMTQNSISPSPHSCLKNYKIISRKSHYKNKYQNEGPEIFNFSFKFFLKLLFDKNLQYSIIVAPYV